MDSGISWDVIRSYIQRFGLARNQIESFNYFCTDQLPSIIRETASTVRRDNNGVDHSIEFIDVHITRPQTREADGFVRPSTSAHETALRGNSYLSDILVDVNYKRSQDGRELGSRLYTGVEVFKIPMMVGSRYCPSFNSYEPTAKCSVDTGGYFVINSSEKSVICQEKLAINRCFVWPSKGQTKDKFICEIRSCNEGKLRSTSTLTMGIREHTGGQLPSVAVQLPFVDGSATLCEVFLMLGVDKIEDMHGYVANGLSESERLKHTAWNVLQKDFENEKTADAVMRAMGKRSGHGDGAKGLSYMQHVIECEFLPHVGLDRSLRTMKSKSAFFGFMVRKLLLVYIGERPPDDRDNYYNKLVDGPGMLMSLLVRQLWRQFLKTLGHNFAKTLEGNKQLNVPDLIRAPKVSSGILYAFSTGSWGVSKSPGDRAGVVQMMNRASCFAVLASLRRINTPVNKDSKSPPVRQLHSSSWGIVCATETPEGASCGLIKNLALLTHVRVGCSTKQVMKLIGTIPEFAPLDSIDVFDWAGDMCYLMVNGQIKGSAQDADKLITTLRRMRRKGLLPFDVSIFPLEYANVVHVQTDPGALCRPVFFTDSMAEIQRVYDDCKGPISQKFLFERLLHSGCICYLDKTEESFEVVKTDATSALTSGARFFEIHPCAILGLCANMIPYPEFNQAPRNTYQAAMGKQALGLPACNSLNRFDTVSHILHNPHRPLVDTKVSEIIGTPTLPSGQMFVVGIMSYGGYNQEDSLIVNAGSVNRGLGRCDVYRTYKYDVPLTGQDAFCIERPPNTCVGRKFGNYDKLNGKGHLEVGTSVENGDVIVGITMKTKTEIKDCSIIYKHGPAVVDAVWRCKNKDGKDRICIRTREHRLPRPGDKFSSRHGQKGVIGRCMRHEDMPYRLEDGLVPDILVNPHAIPSRMTIGHLLETEVGTVGCMLGKFADGSAFQKISVLEVSQIADEVIKSNSADGVVDSFCNSHMICGKSGEVLQTKCFVGLTWYQKLKHMVRDKSHVRTTGPVSIMTRQPLEGRSRGGGLRFGEMEVQCLLAYGAARNAKEFLFNKSDPFKAYYCRRCGRLAEPPCVDKKGSRIVRSKHAFCRACDSFNYISRVEIPYCGKLFLQLLQAGNIEGRLQIVPDGYAAR